ncbi:hypothetical protein E2C01_066314 [Portunus trituberculatus]|uniref:Uncharacterized protein n=1 Tax=Portunus trituberculatus TaxID=210409 RepID=A0A5B7HGS0_PORTR|nr:hypothetical protein [Portunus trituberculatus]
MLNETRGPTRKRRSESAVLWAGKSKDLGANVCGTEQCFVWAVYYAMRAEQGTGGARHWGYVSEGATGPVGASVSEAPCAGGLPLGITHNEAVPRTRRRRNIILIKHRFG